MCTRWPSEGWASSAEPWLAYLLPSLLPQMQCPRPCHRIFALWRWLRLGFRGPVDVRDGGWVNLQVQRSIRPGRGSRRKGGVRDGLGGGRCTGAGTQQEDRAQQERSNAELHWDRSRSRHWHAPWSACAPECTTRHYTMPPNPTASPGSSHRKSRVRAILLRVRPFGAGNMGPFPCPVCGPHPTPPAHAGTRRSTYPEMPAPFP